MSKKFTPSVGKKEKLDAFVNKNTKTSEEKTKKEEIERKQHGYLIRPSYIKKVTYLSATLDKKRWEVVEEALEAYFEKHQGLLDKFDL
ncbi:hypothetical protein ACE193_25570 (plasmid) [Bernardetia sp. OM2101]|uniref:hypothetical protein n=1 Tax=Bernardetia sp. OM2101 TaxID=3344876 RepID=UPI0035D03BDB